MDQGKMNYEAFLAGDDDGLVRIIRDYKDGLIFYLNSFVRNLFVAEELTEEVFVKLVLKKPKFKSESAFKTWLYAIGRNTALSFLRHNQNREIFAQETWESNEAEREMESSYIFKEEQRILRRAMDALKPEYRQVLWLVYFEGFSHKETAKIIGKTTHNVETLTYRARLALKSKLQEVGFVYEKL